MIAFCDEQIPILPELLKQKVDVVLFSGRELSNNELLKSKCEALFVRSTTKVNSSLLQQTNVKFVGTATSGIDHIDVDYLKSKGIYLVDSKGSNANSVAEYVVFSLLHWQNTIQVELPGSIIGIIGFGNIGKLVARYSNYLGLKVLINDPPLKEIIEQGLSERFPDYCEYCDFPEIIKYSNIVSNHVPLTFLGKYPTNYLLNEHNLQLLKKNTLFVHTSRGGVVEEKSLIKLIFDKNLSLVIDVWENEPKINLNLLKTCLIATPHIAGYSYDGKLRGAKKLIDEFQKFFGIKIDTSILDQELSHYKPAEKSLFSNYSKLYQQLKQSRQILEDYEKFKKILEIDDPNEKSRYFDFLRKSYPIRRETL